MILGGSHLTPPPGIEVGKVPVLRRFLFHKKGVSGNPGGRPKLPAEIKEMFQAKGPEALEVLTRCLQSDDDPSSEQSGAKSIDTVKAFVMMCGGKHLRKVIIDRNECESWCVHRDS